MTTQKFNPKTGKGVPAEELEDAEAEADERDGREHLRRMLPWIDVDVLLETGEYRRLAGDAPDGS